MNTENQIFVHNAGLTVLNLYLPRYFDLLGMLDENQQFKDRDSQERAGHLIQYLTTGQQATEEHLLVYNKILCGLSFDDSVSSGIEISEQEIEVSNQMLGAVLQNWDKMKNSTIENLRESFLLRDGKLEEKEDHWELVVEQKPYDVLLDSLPWNMSLVSLPWMEKKIQCTWR